MKMPEAFLNSKGDVNDGNSSWIISISRNSDVDCRDYFWIFKAMDFCRVDVCRGFWMPDCGSEFQKTERRLR